VSESPEKLRELADLHWQNMKGIESEIHALRKFWAQELGFMCKYWIWAMAEAREQLERQKIQKGLFDGDRSKTSGL